MASDTKAKAGGSVKKVAILAAVVMAFCVAVIVYSTRTSVVPPLHAPPNMRRPDHSPAQHNYHEVSRPEIAPKVAPKFKVAPKSSPAALKLQEGELSAQEKVQRNEVWKIKSRGVVMEQSPEALAATGKLQAITRKLLMARYGKYAVSTERGGTVFRVEITVAFPDMMPDLKAKGKTGVILVETAPISLMPHAVFLFMEIVSNWKAGAFHRNAGHVLQITTQGHHLGLAFQEYSPKFPHVLHTLGYAGRPGGPGFYISTVDNTHNHGPASQGSKSEADSCFGRVVKGAEVVDRLLNVWGTRNGGFEPGGNGFLENDKQHAFITPVLVTEKGHTRTYIQ